VSLASRNVACSHADVELEPQSSSKWRWVWCRLLQCSADTSVNCSFSLFFMTSLSHCSLCVHCLTGTTPHVTRTHEWKLDFFFVDFKATNLVKDALFCAVQHNLKVHSFWPLCVWKFLRRDGHSQVIQELRHVNLVSCMLGLKKPNVILIGTSSCIMEEKRTQFGLANLGWALARANHEGHPSSAPCSFSAPYKWFSEMRAGRHHTSTHFSLIVKPMQIQSLEDICFWCQCNSWCFCSCHQQWQEVFCSEQQHKQQHNTTINWSNDHNKLNWVD